MCIRDRVQPRTQDLAKRLPRRLALVVSADRFVFVPLRVGKLLQEALAEVGKRGAAARFGEHRDAIAVAGEHLWNRVTEIIPRDVARLAAGAENRRAAAIG